MLRIDPELGAVAGGRRELGLDRRGQLRVDAAVGVRDTCVRDTDEEHGQGHAAHRRSYARAAGSIYSRSAA